MSSILCRKKLVQSSLSLPFVRKYSVTYNYTEHQLGKTGKKSCFKYSLSIKYSLHVDALLAGNSKFIVAYSNNRAVKVLTINKSFLSRDF